MLGYIQTCVITACVIKHLVKMVIKGLHLYTDSTYIRNLFSLKRESIHFLQSGSILGK